MFCIKSMQYFSHCVILNSVPLSIKMNFEGPILGKIDLMYEWMESSADFDFIGMASKYEECRSIHVKIHLNPLLDCSKGPSQSRHMPSNGLYGIGKRLLSYSTLCVAC